MTLLLSAYRAGLSRTPGAQASQGKVTARTTYLEAFTVLLLAIRLLAMAAFLMLTDHFGLKGLQQ